MSIFSREELRTLVERTEGPCVSIFMPTHRAGKETRQDPIRLKNLAREAEKQLMAGGLQSSEVKELLAPVKGLLEDVFFWRYQSDGLAIFCSVGLFRSYRLPVTFKELMVVTGRFHVKPLLQLLTGDGKFYILALSQNEVRLLEATHYGVSVVELEGVPKSLAEALQFDDKESQLQFHTPAPVGGGERAAVFHGHGVGADDTKTDIMRYFIQVDRGLSVVLKNERAPIVLAGVDYLLPIYGKVNTYRNLLEESVSGNPEGQSPEELRDHAWNIVEPHFLKEWQCVVSRYGQLAGTERASNKLAKVVSAAYHGKIEELFVAIGVQRWGTFDINTNRVSSHKEAQPGDEDLLDFAAVHTLLHGGTAYAVTSQEVPGDTPVAAVFRY